MEEQRDHFYCEHHRPPTPEGFQRGINLRGEKKCERLDCNAVAKVVIFPKPLNYPKLRNA